MWEKRSVRKCQRREDAQRIELRACSASSTTASAFANANALSLFSLTCAYASVRNAMRRLSSRSVHISRKMSSKMCAATSVWPDTSPKSAASSVRQVQDQPGLNTTGPRV